MKYISYIFLIDSPSLCTPHPSTHSENVDDGIGATNLHIIGGKRKIMSNIENIAVIEGIVISVCTTYKYNKEVKYIYMDVIMFILLQVPVQVGKG